MRVRVRVTWSSAAASSGLSTTCSSPPSSHAEKVRLPTESTAAKEEKSCCLVRVRV